MSNASTEEEYYETLRRWQELQVTVAKLQAEERALRESLFKGAFRRPKEGVNNYELPDGRILKGTRKIYRNVIQDAIGSLPEPLRTEVLKPVWELRVGPYKKLDKEQQKIVDSVLKISEGLPTLDVVEPKGWPPDGK